MAVCVWMSLREGVWCVRVHAYLIINDGLGVWMGKWLPFGTFFQKSPRIVIWLPGMNHLRCNSWSPPNIPIGNKIILLHVHINLSAQRGDFSSKLAWFNNGIPFWPQVIYLICCGYKIPQFIPWDALPAKALWGKCDSGTKEMQSLMGLGPSQPHNLI